MVMDAANVAAAARNKTVLVCPKVKPKSLCM